MTSFWDTSTLASGTEALKGHCKYFCLFSFFNHTFLNDNVFPLCPFRTSVLWSSKSLWNSPNLQSFRLCAIIAHEANTLHSPNVPTRLSLMLVKGTVSGLRKSVEISTGHVIHCYWDNSNIYSDQPITKEWYQPICGHISHPILSV